MTVASVEGFVPDRSHGALKIDWPLVATVGGGLLMIVAVLASAGIPQLREYLDELTLRAIAGTAFALAMTLPVIFCWRRAVRDNQLPATKGVEPQYEHVSGWNAILLFLVVVGIAGVVWWAAQSDDASRQINSEWGRLVVVGLVALFLLVAAAPLVPRAIRVLRLEGATSKVAQVLNAPVDWLGMRLSAVDGLLVFAFANAAGTNRTSVLLRYGLLVSVIASCAALGYYWPAPWAFVPIAWGFIVAFSVSRRWAWIEQDRELAMLNSTISQAHIRVGFSQNLRDEALVAFLSMFLLVPLALRQAQILAQTNDVELFALAAGADINSLTTWISFYGTELAKAVPFVDWTEIYHVEGAASVSAESDLSQHAVFLTRVLIDLVFLAALLQAISSASRDAQQRDLFYKKQSIHRLDPFTEPDAFRALVRKSKTGEWEKNGDRFDDFPRHYDTNRLVELTVSTDERVAIAARLLLERDEVLTDPHHKLSSRAADPEVTLDEMNGLINDVENAGPDRNAYQLALARKRLLRRKEMRAVRSRLMSMLVQSKPIAERIDRLIEAMVGEHRESYALEREIALEALAPDAPISPRIEAAINQVADHDGSNNLRVQARRLRERYGKPPNSDA